MWPNSGTSISPGCPENRPQRVPIPKRIVHAMVCWSSQVYHLSLQLFTLSSGVRAEKGSFYFSNKDPSPGYPLTVPLLQPLLAEMETTVE